MIKTILTIAMMLAVLSAGESKMKVIPDTDIGDDIDDAWALAFVLAHDGFEPLGVTAAHRNTPVRARIAHRQQYTCRNPQDTPRALRSRRSEAAPTENHPEVEGAR